MTSLDLEIQMDVHIALGPSASQRTRAQNAIALEKLYRILVTADSEKHFESSPDNSFPYHFILRGLPQKYAWNLAHEINNQLDDIYAKPVRIPVK